MVYKSSRFFRSPQQPGLAQTETSGTLEADSPVIAASLGQTNDNYRISLRDLTEPVHLVFRPFNDVSILNDDYLWLILIQLNTCIAFIII